MDTKEQDFAFDSMGAESMNAAEPENADGTKPGDGGFEAGIVWDSTRYGTHMSMAVKYMGK